MAGVSFNKPQSGVNTDRIAASSRAFTPAKSASSTEKARDSQTNALVRRERFDAQPADPFVEVNGKRYYLNAPRGTYLNILV